MLLSEHQLKPNTPHFMSRAFGAHKKSGMIGGEHQVDVNKSRQGLMNVVSSPSIRRDKPTAERAEYRPEKNVKESRRRNTINSLNLLCLRLLVL
jgi:hypothetical protein